MRPETIELISQTMQNLLCFQTSRIIKGLTVLESLADDKPRFPALRNPYSGSLDLRHDVIPKDEDPTAWVAADFKEGDHTWTVSLPPVFMDELCRRLEKFKRTFESENSLGGDNISIAKVLTCENFPLSDEFKAFLRKHIREPVEGGKGFVRLKLLPKTTAGDHEGAKMSTKPTWLSWSTADHRIALYGLGVHLGWPEKQDGAGNMIHEVKDYGLDPNANGQVRYFQTNSEIPFHTDGCDALA